MDKEKQAIIRCYYTTIDPGENIFRKFNHFIVIILN